MTRIACNLNRIPLPMLLAALMAALPVVSSRLHAAEAGYSTPARHSLTIACDKRHISQRQASRLLGIDNFSQAYARRAAIHAQVARACAAGAAAVRLDGEPASAGAARLSQR